MTKFSGADMVRHDMIEMERRVHDLQTINAELLEALEAAHNALDTLAVIVSDSGDESAANDAAELAMQIRAAIAKARGES